MRVKWVIWNADRARPVGKAYDTKREASCVADGLEQLLRDAFIVLQV
jgi:hypothetical protein